MKYILILTALIFPAPSLAADSHPVCSFANFQDFILQFSTLSQEDQNTCIQYPVERLDGSGESLKNRESLSVYHFAGRRLVFDESDIDYKERSSPFFSPGDARLNKVQTGRMGYIYSDGQGSDGMHLRLIHGGEPQIQEELRFNYNGQSRKWLLTGVAVAGYSAGKPADGEESSSGQSAGDSFDISGLKLGRPGGAGLKKTIEALPEGYKCLDINFSINENRTISRDRAGKKNLAGYSCFTPQAPSSPFIISGGTVRRDSIEAKDGEIINTALKHLLVLCDENHDQVLFIYKREKFPESSKAPLLKTMSDAMAEKYGPPTYFDSPSNSFHWAISSSGKKISGRMLSPQDWLETHLSTLLNRPVKMPFFRLSTQMPSDIGVLLTSDLYGNKDETCREYFLTLFDAKFWHDWLTVDQKRKETIAAPSF